MITVSIIGSGNVAQHLISVFEQAENLMLQQVFSRKRDHLQGRLGDEKIATCYSELKPADIFILAVSDAAIQEVSQLLPFENHLVVHTSGSASMDSIDPKNRKGVFYPLQTFSKAKTIDFKKVPLCIETEAATDYFLLESLAKAVSDQVFRIDSKQRLSLHVAAVFSCNFVNHLYQLGHEICEEHDVPFEILYPLIQETADKIKTLSPKEAQTGPAKRNDMETIEKHLSFLSDENKNTIYKLLTQSIQNHNG